MAPAEAGFLSICLSSATPESRAFGRSIITTVRLLGTGTMRPTPCVDTSRSARTASSTVISRTSSTRVSAIVGSTSRMYEARSHTSYPARFSPGSTTTQSLGAATCLSAAARGWLRTISVTGAAATAPCASTGTCVISEIREKTVEAFACENAQVTSRSAGGDERLSENLGRLGSSSASDGSWSREPRFGSGGWSSRADAVAAVASRPAPSVGCASSIRSIRPRIAPSDTAKPSRRSASSAVAASMREEKPVSETVNRSEPGFAPRGSDATSIRAYPAS